MGASFAGMGSGRMEATGSLVGASCRGRAVVLARGMGAALALLSAQAAWAQAVPAVPGQIAPTREEVERVRPQPQADERPRLTVEGDGIERAPCALDTEANRGITFPVGSVTFEGLQEVSAEELRPAWAEFAGQTVPIATVCEIRDRAATILRNKGYIAAVEVPEQRIADGAVTFRVLMAKLVAIRVRGNAGNAEQTIAGYLNRLTEEPVFNRFRAERYLLLASDLPGYQVRLSLRSAGGAPGEVIGEVAVLRTPSTVDVNLQNFGSRDLGRFGALVRGQFYGLTGAGDRTTIAAFSTLDFQEQQTLQLAHDFRIGSEGLALSGQLTYAYANPDLGLPAFDVEAETLLATVSASYPFIRSQAGTVRGAVGFDFIDQDVDVNNARLTSDGLRVGFIRLDADAVDEGSLNRVGGYSAAEPRWRLAGNVELRKGFDIFGARDCGRANALCNVPGGIPFSRAEGDPEGFSYRVEALGEYRPVPNITFALGVRAQWSPDKLLSFEEFSAGNYTVGRGYDPGTLIADRGFGVQAELRFGSILPQSLDSSSLQPYVFFDAAWVQNNDIVNRFDRRQSLYSAGGGLRALFGDKIQADVVLAVPLRRAGLLTDTPDPRILVSLTTKLLPWSF